MLVLLLVSSASVQRFELCSGACAHGMVMKMAPASARVWGQAQPLSNVSIQLTSANGKSWRTIVVSNANGSWSVQLPPQPASVNSSLLAMSMGQSFEVNDIAFGAVLLCGGQSNMEYSLASSDVDPRDIDGEMLRLFRPDHLSAPNATVSRLTWGHSWDGAPGCTDRCGMPWVRANFSGRDTQSFSAVCISTALHLMAKMAPAPIPFGLVQVAWGGTRIESWMSTDALKKCPGEKVRVAVGEG